MTLHGNTIPHRTKLIFPCFDSKSAKQVRLQKGTRVFYRERGRGVRTSCYFNRELKPRAKTELSKLSRERKIGSGERDIAKVRYSTTHGKNMSVALSNAT